MKRRRVSTGDARAQIDIDNINDAIRQAEEKDGRIKLCTYNMRDGRNGGLESALRAMAQANVDVGVLTEAKLPPNIYARCSSGYNVIATASPNQHQGGLAIFYRNSEHWQLEAHQTFGHNVVSFQLSSGRLRWYVVGSYIPPESLAELDHIVKAFTQCPEGVETLWIGDLNADLAFPERERDGEIAAVAAAEGLEDMVGHFRQKEKMHNRQHTWRMVREGSIISSRTDYFLGTDRRYLRAVSVKEPRHDSDHRMIVGVLSCDKLKENKRCIMSQQRYPLKAPTGDNRTELDIIFAELKERIPKVGPRELKRNAWISEGTWQLIDQRIALRRQRRGDQQMCRGLGRRIKASLKEDRRRRAAEAGEQIEACINHRNPDWKEAWGILKGWYRDASDRAPPPARATIEKVTQERVDLCSRRDPVGEPIEVVLEAPFDIIDDIPDLAEISAAASGLRTNRAGGPSGMRGEHLKTWIAQAGLEGEDAEPEAWQSVVKLVQTAFETGELPTELFWSTVVLLPKGGGDFRGIGLIEVIWKLIATIIDKRLKKAEHHDALHGFRAKRGTGTATIEAKLLQQIAGVRNTPFFEIFLDLHKAYDALDRKRTLDTLRSYRVGERVIRLR